MYSEVLSIMDRNTVSLMIDELKADNEKKDSEISALKAQNEILLKQLNGQNKSSS